MARRNARLRMFVKIDASGQFVSNTNVWRLKKPGGNKNGNKWAEIYPDVCCTTTTTTSTSTTTTTT